MLAFLLSTISACDSSSSKDEVTPQKKVFPGFNLSDDTLQSDEKKAVFEAMEKAKSEDKLLWLRASAAWCLSCFMIDSNFEDHKEFKEFESEKILTLKTEKMLNNARGIFNDFIPNDAFNTYLPNSWIYNPKTNQWTAFPSMYYFDGDAFIDVFTKIQNEVPAIEIFEERLDSEFANTDNKAFTARITYEANNLFTNVILGQGLEEALVKRKEFREKLATLVDPSTIDPQLKRLSYYYFIGVVKNPEKLNDLTDQLIAAINIEGVEVSEYEVSTIKIFMKRATLLAAMNKSGNKGLAESCREYANEQKDILDSAPKDAKNIVNLLSLKTVAQTFNACYFIENKSGLKDSIKLAKAYADTLATNKAIDEDISLKIEVAKLYALGGDMENAERFIKIYEVEEQKYLEKYRVYDKEQLAKNPDEKEFWDRVSRVRDKMIKNISTVVNAVIIQMQESNAK